MDSLQGISKKGVKFHCCSKCYLHGFLVPYKDHHQIIYNWQLGCRFKYCEGNACGCYWIAKLKQVRNKFKSMKNKKCDGMEYEVEVLSGNSDEEQNNRSCAKCTNHLVKAKYKNHSLEQGCPYAKCRGKLCKLTDEQRKSMKEVIRLTRRMKAKFLNQAEKLTKAPTSKTNFRDIQSLI